MVSVAIDDPLRLPIGGGARALARSYGTLVRTSPSLWGLVFRGFSRPAAVTAMHHYLWGQLGPAIDRRTRERGAAVVVVCHPLLGQTVSRAARSGDGNPRLVTVMTDLVGGHPSWLAARPDALITATPEATRWSVERGLAPHLVWETGLPIDPDLAAGPLDLARRRDLRLALGLEERPPVILVGGGAEGAGPIGRLLRWVDRGRPQLQLVVACGHNRRLQQRLRRKPLSVPTLVLGYQRSLTPWIRAADVYLGKAGPSTLAEAAAAGLAILVAGELPGQESENGRALARHGAAVEVRGRRALLRLLARLCRPEDPLLPELRRGARAWSRPSAAWDAAGVVLSLLPSPSPDWVSPPPQGSAAAGGPFPRPGG